MLHMVQTARELYECHLMYENNTEERSFLSADESSFISTAILVSKNKTIGMEII